MNIKPRQFAGCELQRVGFGRSVGALQCSLRGFASAPLFGMLVDNSPKSLVNTRQFGLVEYSRI